MRHLLIRVALAVTAAVAITPVQAQVPQTAYLPPQSPPPAYSAGAYPSYPFAPTPEDAYRDVSIGRWEFEHVAGPLPPALPGPPVNSNRGSGGDGRGS